MHRSHATNGDKPRREGGGIKNSQQRSGRMETRRGEEVPHTEKWLSTPVPAPKRSTLGVVAALDSVVGLCSGIESNISKNKDTQSDVHSDFKSSEHRMMD